jgi:hypothetical protein
VLLRPQEIDMGKSPIKALLAKARGESLAKQPFVDMAKLQRANKPAAANASAPSYAAKDDADGGAPPPPPPVADAGAFHFDDKKHVKLNVNSQKPRKFKK